MLSGSIKGRRSISSFTSEKVDLDIIDELISVSGYAPSSCDTQPWFFLVFHSGESKEKLNAYIRRGYECMNQDLKGKHKVLGSVYKKLLNFFSVYGKFDDAPVLILLFAKPYDTVLFSQAIKFAQNEKIQNIADGSVKTSAALAMQNFLLLAHEKGLGTRVKDGMKFLVSFETLKSEFYNEFQIPKEYQLLSGIQLGYPTKEALLRTAPKRLSLDQVRRII